MQAVPDSSGSESELSQEDSGKIEERFDLHLRRRLGAASRKPFAGAICVELLFCALMSKWVRENDVHFSPLERWVPVDEPDLMKLCWGTFIVTGLVRVFCICGRPHVLSSRVLRIGVERIISETPAVYMLAGTLQWVIYLSAFYVEYDAATPVDRVHDVSMTLQEVPTFLGTPLASCLRKNNWSYAACRVGVTKNCTMPYEPDRHYTNGECVETVVVSGQQCCVFEKVVLGQPLLEIGFRVDDLFMLVKWLAILMLGWVVRGWVATPAAASFTSGAWLDILDAVVFSENILSPAVRHPAYGIDFDGSMRLKKPELFVCIFMTWVVAFSTVVLSPVLFTVLMPAVEGPEPSTAELQKEQLQRLEDSLACSDELEARNATQAVLELLRRRRKELQGSDGHPVCVDVPDASRSEHRRGRIIGRAAVQHNAEAYRVKFTDGRHPREGVVSLEHIYPDQDRLEEGSTSCCTGWLTCDTEAELERFLQRAKLLDAIRSLFLLELPFLCWRIYIDWYTVDIANSRILFIFKNAIWAVIDLLTILSCGGDGGVMCSCAPLKHVGGLADTQLGKIWIGPAGLFLLSAQIASSALKVRLRRRRDNLLLHRAWLQAERSAQTGPLHDAKLKEVANQLNILDEKQSFAQLA
ncbi:unnamed protein product [Symbiodinium natans]|uniref:Uncharacterized protein n=1 Tax=Symbiodinium natans TaxID=878477 RepID=A0A812GJJ3_9DINO|nr:unnamed protein product [Symbiodinium natans]